MMANDYSDRYESIITAWEAPGHDSFGEQVRLMDGAVRFVRKDGVMDVGVTLPAGKTQMDSAFSHETELLDTMWTPEVPVLVGETVDQAVDVPAVVSGATPNISESQSRKVRQAVAWEALSENTRASYQKGIKRLTQRGVVVEELTDDSLAVVLSELKDKAGEPLSPATLSLTVAAVKWYFKHVLVVDCDWTTTDKRLVSIKRDASNRGTGQVDGLAWSDVDVITRLSALDGTARGLRDAVLVRLMSDCLLRISEAVAVNVEDLSDSTLMVKRSKTDQTGEGVVLFVGKETMDLIRRYQAVAEVSSGALFRRIRRGDTVTAERLTENGARQAIKDAAELVGISPERVSGHSLRVGAAVSLAKAGASVVEMQGAGRWKSPQMPAHYARAQEAERGAVARLRYGKGK